MNLYGEGTHRFTLSIYSDAGYYRLLWAHSWMDGSEQWVWYQSFGSAYRSSLRFDLEYWEHISTNPQQLFPLINKINYWYFDENGKIKLSIRRIENVSCIPGSQVLLYAELLDLQCFWFLVTFLHRAQYAVKRLCIICFLSSALTDTLMAFCLFLIPWYQICYEQNGNISMFLVIHVIRAKWCNIDFNKYLQPHTAC